MTILNKTSLLKLNFYYLNRLINQSVKMSQYSTVFIKQCEKDDTMKITFSYKYSDFPMQDFTFMRSKTELLDAALTRMKAKIQTAILQKAIKRGKKKAAITVDTVLPPLDIVLVKNGVKIDENVKNAQAWTEDTEVIINDQPYKISLNPPTVTHISLPKSILSGFTVYPKVSLEFCTIDSSLFNWFRNINKHNENSIQNDENIVQINNEKWKLVFTGYVYTTQELDEGHKLRISCTPKFESKEGREAAAVSVGNVVPGPGRCPFDDRHKFTQELTKSGSLRFLSYNILADLYADTDIARNQLFPYCPAEVLALDYRKQLYLREIVGYNADILCLQEVDRGVFHEDLVPILSIAGLKGVFNEKSGQTAEGLGCFYRDAKFKFIESHSIFLSEAIRTEPVLEKLYSKICENEKLSERFLSRTTVLQATLLESLDSPNKRVLVGNTHLYFHPHSDNIRLIQGTCCILYLEQLLNKYREKDSSYTTSLIFGGDFNSSPDVGVYKLATEGKLSSDCIDWKSNAEETVEGLELSHSLKLNSACGVPQYTNFTQGFVGCLDYIFYDTSTLDVTEIVPFPTHEQVIEHIALPNKVFPSDHIALVSTLRWK